MNQPKTYTIAAYLNMATRNLFGLYTRDEIDCYVDDLTLLETDYSCDPSQIEGSEAICAEENTRIDFHTMIERLTFDHVERVHEYRMTHDLVSFHELESGDQEKAYLLWVNQCLTKEFLSSARENFYMEMRKNSLFLTDEFMTKVRNVFTVQANDLIVIGGYEDNAYFLEQVDNYSFNVDKDIVYKHS